ncbi:MAG: lysophospholipid acyltransferase family protein [Tannerellaceae bacterium]|nr:lysophospholipid acyltransferase family protein [Tannerellaceae bacterium]
MKKSFSRWLLKVMGWKVGPEGEDVPKCVICVAPHTSNWDFIFGKLFYLAVGRDAKFLIKKDWFFFPFNLLFDWLGGVPVDRKKKTSVTDQMVEEFNRREKFQLAITPEGTRKAAQEWKKGFYYIANGAHVPIMIAYLDYGKKEIGIKGLFYPTGDVEEDICKIRSYYRGVTARHPERFVE